MLDTLIYILTLILFILFQLVIIIVVLLHSANAIRSTCTQTVANATSRPRERQRYAQEAVRVQWTRTASMVLSSTTIVLIYN